MELLDLELSHFNFYCPATGVQILAEDNFNDDAPSLMGTWIDEVMDTPTINNNELQQAWDKLQEKHHSDVDYDTFEGFLTDYPELNWVVFKITTSGIACGPVSSTAWFVIDMDTQLEEDIVRRDLEKEINYDFYALEPTGELKKLHEPNKLSSTAIYLTDSITDQTHLKPQKVYRVGVWEQDFNSLDEVDNDICFMFKDISPNEAGSVASACSLRWYYYFNSEGESVVISTDPKIEIKFS